MKFFQAKIFLCSLLLAIWIDPSSGFLGIFRTRQNKDGGDLAIFKAVRKAVLNNRPLNPFFSLKRFKNRRKPSIVPKRKYEASLQEVNDLLRKKYQTKLQYNKKVTTRPKKKPVYEIRKQQSVKKTTLDIDTFLSKINKMQPSTGFKSTRREPIKDSSGERDTLRQTDRVPNSEETEKHILETYKKYKKPIADPPSDVTALFNKLSDKKPGERDIIRVPEETKDELKTDIDSERNPPSSINSFFNKVNENLAEESLKDLEQDEVVDTTDDIKAESEEQPAVPEDEIRQADSRPTVLEQLEDIRKQARPTSVKTNRRPISKFPTRSQTSLQQLYQNQLNNQFNSNKLPSKFSSQSNRLPSLAAAQSNRFPSQYDLLSNKIPGQSQLALQQNRLPISNGLFSNRHPGALASNQEKRYVTCIMIFCLESKRNILPESFYNN